MKTFLILMMALMMCFGTYSRTETAADNTAAEDSYTLEQVVVLSRRQH